MSDCPSKASLTAFAQGESVDGIEPHLDGCASCRAWLDAYFGTSLPAPTAGGSAVSVPRHLIESAFEAVSGESAIPQEELPRALGDYDLLEVIGRGGMGVVYRAYERELRREVALKVLAPSLVANPEAAERFQREARAAAALQHANVLPILAFGSLRDSSAVPYLAMPLVKGESLEAKLAREGRLSTAATLDLARRIANGLGAAHEAGIVHRDIKPGNILIDEDGTALIADFGLARMGEDVSLTLPDVRAGTPQFMAPEQAGGGAVGPATDLFSFGVLLYRMLAGRLPFAADSTAATLRALATETPPPLRNVRPEVPGWLSHLVECLLEKNPSDRPASAREVATMLAGESAPGHPSRRQRRARRRLAVAASVILTAGLFAAFEFSGKSAVVNSALARLSGRPFSIRGQWRAYDNLDTAWKAARDGATIEVRLRGDVILRAPEPAPKSVTVRGVGPGNGRLIETEGKAAFHGTGDCLLENLTLVRAGIEESAPQPLVVQENGTLTLIRCRIALEKAPAFQQLSRREAVLRLDDAGLVARDSVLSSARTYLIHLTGERAAALAFENCGLRGFAMLVLDGSGAGDGAPVTVAMRGSTLSALGCFLSPRRRVFPAVTVTGSRNLLRCGVLVWKNDGRASPLDRLDWQMRDSVIGELRALFARDDSIRQEAPASEALLADFAILWPEAALSTQLTDDLGMPRQQVSDAEPGGFAPPEAWAGYGYQE